MCRWVQFKEILQKTPCGLAWLISVFFASNPLLSLAQQLTLLLAHEPYHHLMTIHTVLHLARQPAF